MPRTTATVEALTAQVRVLMVGSRQITLSVYWQLDDVGPELIELFGRVSPSQAEEGWTYAVGMHKESGDLVRSRTVTSRPMMEKILYDEQTAISAIRQKAATCRELAKRAREENNRSPFTGWEVMEGQAEEYEQEYRQRTEARDLLKIKMEADAVTFESLPLIVLAGLR